MQNNDFYKLVGTINIFGLYPDFVYPIFEKDNKYYFSCSKNNIITYFKEITKNLYKVNFLNTNCVKFANIQEKYPVGDKIIIAFQTNKNNFFISDINNFIPFINNFDTDDHILIEEIDNFLDEINLNNHQIKKKRKIHE